ncbi:MAG: hypothetical protein ACKVJG_23475 [Candidatus Latescibacterota bacterium]
MKKEIDKKQVRRWLAGYGDEAARIARALESLDNASGLVRGADVLVFWAHYIECGDGTAEQGQRVSDALKEILGEDGLGVGGGENEVGDMLESAQGFCSWGRWNGGEKYIGAARRMAWHCWRDWERDPQCGIQLSFWVSLLELCSSLLYIQPDRELHIVASRCVATLLNAYYDIETKSFTYAVGFIGGEAPVERAASVSLGLRAVDALMNEAVRCGDGRLFDWGGLCARTYATREGEHADMSSGAIDMLRLIALRSLRHREDSWGKRWIDLEWNAPDNELESRALRQRSACLCLGELEQLAKSDEVSGSLRF